MNDKPAAMSDSYSSSSTSSSSGEDSDSDTSGEAMNSSTTRNKNKTTTATATATATTTKGKSNNQEEEEEEEEQSQYTKKTFKVLGLAPALCTACEELGWKTASLIQAQAIPYALEGRDIIGLAETGSGKTAAFALPMLHSLLLTPRRMFGLVLTPTRELAFQINEQFEAIGGAIGVKTVTIVGGIDMIQQAIALARKPHVIIATPGRLVDHLENTKGFSLRTIGELVLDEADRMLSMDFEEELNRILDVLPRTGCRTSLFSATMTSKVQKLQRASLKNPVKVEVSTKFQTVKNLVQQYIFIPAKHKDCYGVSIVNDFGGKTGIVFCATHKAVMLFTLLLRNLGFSATCLHGGMTQPKRLGALNKFKAGARAILVATDVASRGLDIPSVDFVLNYDVPESGKDYVHRVGRTARAGRSGSAVTLVTQYDVEKYQRIEHLIEKKLSRYDAEKEEVLVMLERVSEAQRYAISQLREHEDGKQRGKRDRDRDRNGRGGSGRGGKGGGNKGGRSSKRGRR
jgi:ATP-dependent RNA helicase DDX47/RRP3